MECGGEHDADLLIRQIGLNGDPQPDQENEASPMGVESNFMSPYSLEDLRELQRQDVELEPVIRWLAADVTPTEADLMSQSSSTKHVLVSGAVEIATMSPVLRMGSWAVEEFAVGDTRLTQRQGDSAVLWHDVRWAPRSWQNNGEDKTEGILVWNVNWCASLCCNLQAVHSEQEISTDYACSITKLSSRESWWSGAFGHAGAILWESSGEQICIDDYWSVHSVAGNGPFTIARCGVCCQGIFQILNRSFGVPWCVHMDQGRNFDSELFKTFCELLDAVKTRTTPYRPCWNGQVERYNQLVLNFLRCFLGTQQKEWVLICLHWEWVSVLWWTETQGSLPICCSSAERWICRRISCLGCLSARSHQKDMLTIPNSW